MFKSVEGNFDNQEVNELLTKHFVELRAASPEGSAHVLDIPGLKVPSIKFWSLWDDEKLIGCGALKFLDKEHGEFKSIRIHDNFRMQGQGINVINHLILYFVYKVQFDFLSSLPFLHYAISLKELFLMNKLL